MTVYTIEHTTEDKKRIKVIIWSCNDTPVQMEIQLHTQKKPKTINLTQSWQIETVYEALRAAYRNPCPGFLQKLSEK